MVVFTQFSQGKAHHRLEIEHPVLESVLDFSDAAQLDGLEYSLSEDLIDIPEDSVVDTESSHGQGHWLGHAYDESDGC